MKNLFKKIKQVLKEIMLGFELAEKNREKSQWGKF
jgi:hypothetical protein